MRKLQKALDMAARALTFCASLGLLAMMLHVCSDVIMAYVFNSPIAGTAEVVAYYYMVGAVFLPLPLVELRNASINVDLIYGLVGRRTQRAMLRIAYFVQLVFFTILVWQSGVDAIEAVMKGELVEGRMNVFIWPGRIFLPIGFALAALVSLLLLLRSVFEPDFDPDNLSLRGAKSASEGTL